MEIMSGASAKQMPNRRYEEMLNEGALAVVAVMWKYDPEKGRPTTFFKLPIRHVLVAFANNATTGVMSRNEAARVTKVKQSCTNLARNGLQPTPEAVSADTGYPINEVITIMEVIQAGRLGYLDAPSASDDESPIGYRIPARDGNPYIAAVASERSAVWRRALEALDEREREFLVASTIGIVNLETGKRKVMSATALGIKHGITTHAADTIIATARRKLRTNPELCKYYRLREGVRQEDPTFGQISAPATDYFDYLDDDAEKITIRSTHVDSHVAMRFRFRKA